MSTEDRSELVEGFRARGVLLDKEEAEQLMADADVNNDGRLEFDEFFDVISELKMA